MKLFLCLIGLLLIVEGLPYFAFPDKMKNWMKILLEIPAFKLRLIGFFSMCAGLLLTYLFCQ